MAHRADGRKPRGPVVPRPYPGFAPTLPVPRPRASGDGRHDGRDPRFGSAGTRLASAIPAPVSPAPGPEGWDRGRLRAAGRDGPAPDREPDPRGRCGRPRIVRRTQPPVGPDARPSCRRCPAGPSHGIVRRRTARERRRLRTRWGSGGSGGAGASPVRLSSCTRTGRPGRRAAKFAAHRHLSVSVRRVAPRFSPLFAGARDTLGTHPRTQGTTAP